MHVKSERATPVRDQSRLPTQRQRVSSYRNGDNCNSNDLARIPTHVLRKMLKKSRKKTRKTTQSLHDLQQERDDLQMRHQEVIRDHQQQRQKLQEMRQNCLDLRREQQSLRKENSEKSAEIEELYVKLQNLHQERQQPERERREPNCDHRQLTRDHQALHTAHQDLQCKENELQQDLAYAESETRALKQELKSGNVMTESEDQTLELKFCQSRYEFIIDEVVKPFAASRDLEYKDGDGQLMDLVLTSLRKDVSQASKLRKQVEKLLYQLQKSQIEASSLREQVQELQKEMLARVKKVQAVSDEQFAQDFRSLGAHVKSFSRSIRLKPGVNILQILASGSLLSNTSEHHWKIRANQKYYIEAWIWSVLLDLIFASAFSIYGKFGTVCSTNWKWVFGSGHEGMLPRPTALSESFRCTIADHLVSLVGRDTTAQRKAAANECMGQTARRCATATLECREKVANTIGTKLTSISSTVDVSEISSIVDRAFALALDMSLQKCRLQITYPAIGATFDISSMTSMPDLDGDDIDDGVVAFVVNPSLTKWGDAHGKMLDQRYDIVPSLVQLEPVKVKREHF